MYNYEIILREIRPPDSLRTGTDKEYTVEQKVRAGIVGATGYAGVELVRLLSGHPHVEIAAVSSVSFGGQDFSKIYPGFRGGFREILMEDPKDMPKKCEVVFASLPHGLSEEMAEACMDGGVLFIDLGADFRCV